MLNSQTKQTFIPTFFQRHWTKLIAVVFWLLAVGGYYAYVRQNNLTFEDSIYQIAALLESNLFGPIIYILIYALRPLIFFPSTILTLLGGFLFGPIGILYTIFGSNTSAMVAYGVGHYFGQDILNDKDATGLIQQYTQRMRKNSFETVLIMRLIFLPYDLVNYAAGFLKINWKAFLAATAIGSIPGTISFVLFGASFGTLAELLSGKVELNPTTIFASVAVIGVSIVLSRTIKNKESQKETA